MAQESPVMEKLARSLSESERKRFLSQIHNSLKDDEHQQRQLKRRETEEDEITLLLKNDLRQLSPFKYLLLSVRRLFTGKNILQLLKEMQIKQLKRRVRRKNHGIVNFETRSLKPELAEEIFDLYILTIPFQRLFHNVWSSEPELGRLHELIFSLIEDQIEVNVESCYDLLPLDHMVALYRQHGSAEAVIEEVHKSIDLHVDSIDRERFKTVERQVTSLYKLRDLVLFPFPHLFQLFHGTIRQDDPEIKPLFQRTSAIAALDILEELYYALHNASKAEIAGRFTEWYIERLFGMQGEQGLRETVYEEGDEYESAEDEGRDEDEVENEAEPFRGGAARFSEEEESLVETSPETFLRDVDRLQKAARKFIKNVPLPELIRAMLDDPYYRLVVYVPDLNIADFYRSMKKMSLHNELEELIQKVRQEALTRERAELFQGVKMRALHYYRSYSSIDYDKLGVMSFRYYQGLLVLYNFLIIYYKGAVQRVLQLVENLIPEQDRITRERLQKHASAAEDVLYKIRELDDSLSGEQDDGKSFLKLRFENSLDSGQRRIYQHVVMKKDREALELLTKGREALRGILLLFNEFLQNRDLHVQSGLSKKYLIQGKAFSLYEVIQHNIVRLELLAQIETQLDQIRDETGFDEVSL